MQQRIPLGQYEKISVSYISIIDGGGTSCDNCGRLISNMVNVKHEGGKRFTIGQDCAKTLFSKLENETIAKDIKEDKRNKANKIKYAAQNKRREVLNALLSDSSKAGISNDNINTQWAKDTFNNLLAIHEAKNGGYITWRR